MRVLITGGYGFIGAWIIRNLLARDDRVWVFDLKEDPEETINLAGRASYAAIEKDLKELAERNWDGPRLKKSVIRDQQERLLVRTMAAKWDYTAGTSGPYLREPGIRN